MKIKTSSQFRKDIKRLIKRGFDISLIEKAIEILETGNPLPEEYNSHPLKGEWKGCYEFHIKSDWIVIYEIIEEKLVLILLRTGTHQDLFKNY